MKDKVLIEFLKNSSNENVVITNSHSQNFGVNLNNIIYIGRNRDFAPGYKPTWCMRCAGCYVFELDEEPDWSLWETLHWERLELGDNCFVYCNPRHLVWRELDSDINGYARFRFTDSSYLTALVDAEKAKANEEEVSELPLLQVLEEGKSES